MIGWWWLACRAPEAPGPGSDTDLPGDTDPAPDDSALPTGSTGTTGATADTAVPVTSVFPPAPYDCSAGVPPGPPAVRPLPGVATTEGLTFDTLGYLVAWDRSTNAVAYDAEGAATVISPSAGESRGMETMLGGDIAFSGNDTRIRRLHRDTGAVEILADISGIGGLADMDLAADGTIAVASLSLRAYVWLPSGTVQSFETDAQLYGAAFSVDETRIYWSEYTFGGGILTSDLQPDGTWSAPARWVELDGAELMSGIAVDACGNVYTVGSFDCRVYRITPDGVPELLIALDLPRQASCPNLAFGRGLGGWDAYELVVSTYHDAVVLEVGVSGRPR